jgi:hypothetical protein
LCSQRRLGFPQFERGGQKRSNGEISCLRHFRFCHFPARIQTANRHSSFHSYYLLMVTCVRGPFFPFPLSLISVPTSQNNLSNLRVPCADDLLPFRPPVRAGKRGDRCGKKRHHTPTITFAVCQTGPAALQAVESEDPIKLRRQ